jgi:hypothetical protein
VLSSIDASRGRFDQWARDPAARLVGLFRDARGGPLPWHWLAVAVLLLGMLFDCLWFRPLAWSDEGKAFDVAFRTAFGLGLTLLTLDLARLISMWKDLRSVLHGSALMLGSAFEHVPAKVLDWSFDEEASREQYDLWLRRQAADALAQLRGWDRTAVPATTQVRWDTVTVEIETNLTSLDAICATTSDQDRALTERRAVRCLVKALAVRWASQPVGPKEDSGAESVRGGKSRKKTSPELLLIDSLERVLALEVARWLALALARTWWLVASLVVTGLALLFAITSYPFPEQPRVMAVVGLVLAVLALTVVRVVFGLSRDPVISRIEGTAPGEISWDSALFSRLGTFVVPVVGVLAAVSFDMLDLFRSVLGPILRIIP